MRLEGDGGGFMRRQTRNKLGHIAVICGLSIFAAIAGSAGTNNTCKAYAADGVTISTQTFPDAAFRNYIKKNVDKNKDVKLQLSERYSVRELNISRKKIGNLKGIQYFGELRVLDCSRNKLTGLDLKKNSKLVVLNCSGNKLSELDVSRNERIYNLDCSNNRLTKIDVSNIGPLQTLKCRSNRLAQLDLSANAELVTVNCEYNKIKKLMVSERAGYIYSKGNRGIKVKKISCKPLKKGQYVIEMTQSLGGSVYKCYRITNASKKKPTVTLVDMGDAEVTAGYWEYVGYETNLGMAYTVTAIGDGDLAGHTISRDYDGGPIRIGGNIRRIGDRAFARCKQVYDVDLAATVSTLGDEVFSGCRRLKTLTIRSTRMTDKTLSKNTFKGIPSSTVIKVPKNKLTQYKKLFKKCGLGSKVKIVAIK